MNRSGTERATNCLAATLLCLIPFVVHADNFADIDAYVAAYQQMAAFDGVVLIAEGDDIIWQKAFGSADYANSLPMTVDTRFRIASLSKQVTQAAIGKLVDEEKLTLHSRLSDFLPEFPNARRITIRHLLDHRAGIANTNRLDWLDMSVPMSLDDIVAGLANEKLLFTPGIDWQYSDGGYALLAKVIEVASNRSYGQYIKGSFADAGYPSIGDESTSETVMNMAERYAPGPIYGERVAAETYITANRIGSGSIYGNAEDIFRFFRDSFTAKLLSEETTKAIFAYPEDGDVQATGRAPGALAQISMNLDDELTVVTLSSNSAWQGSFTSDIVSLYRGDNVTLTPFSISDIEMPADDLATFSGNFRTEKFDWAAAIEPFEGGLVFIQDGIRTAFARTTDNQFHIPLYDWLCRFSAYNTEFVCRQRDPDIDIRFLFERI